MAQTDGPCVHVADTEIQVDGKSLWGSDSTLCAVEQNPTAG